MCILVANVASGLVPKYTIEIASNVDLLTAIVAYQKNPGTETYNAVQTVLQSITNEYNKVLLSLNGSLAVLTIFDSDTKMLWFTGDKSIEKYVASVYSDNSYNVTGKALGTVFKQFEDGFTLQGGWAGGFPLYAGGRPSFTFALTLLDKSLIADPNGLLSYLTKTKSSTATDDKILNTDLTQPLLNDTRSTKLSNIKTSPIINPLQIPSYTPPTK
jgi:hypothetical protein